MFLYVLSPTYQRKEQERSVIKVLAETPLRETTAKRTSVSPSALINRIPCIEGNIATAKVGSSCFVVSSLLRGGDGL